MDYAPRAGKYAGRACDVCDDDIYADQSIRYDEEASRVTHDHCWRAVQAYAAEKLVIAAQTARCSGSTASAYEMIMVQARHHANEAITR